MLEVRLKAVTDPFTGVVRLIEHVELGELAHAMAKALEAGGVDLEDEDVEAKLNHVMGYASMVLCSTWGEILKHDVAADIYTRTLNELGVEPRAMIAAPAQRAMN
ncbi:hypothetical protein [uncultured Methylobacterium sp.]|jgi:hypothetical protein|uniref:hypothetical protein n=1 Tax=uncultured Methylobacterium sp. TaxID=157278 RepID=UPI00262A54E3|nr:hypothetical protein [uncultured Methylobacterium sp.]